MKSESASYRDSGVDITAGYQAVELMKAHVNRTMIPGVLGGIGSFGGMFELDLGQVQHPVLVSGTDGVGTKLKLAFLLDRHDTVGIDCVAMCVNDVICAGAKPLFFLDYVAVGKNVPERVAAVVAGVAEGCVQAGCALIGGETAEMPGFYPEEEYDLAGFCVGVVDKTRILNHDDMRPGDVVIALPSSGVHSNGFSLVRKVFGIGQGGANQTFAGLEKPLWDTLLTPTKIYVKPILALLEKMQPSAISHITGGGFYENMPRALGKGCSISVRRAAVRVLPIFDLIARQGNIPERDMFNTFNMGVGMTVVVHKDQAEEALAILQANGEPDAYFLGEIVPGDNEVIICEG